MIPASPSPDVDRLRAAADAVLVGVGLATLLALAGVAALILSQRPELSQAVG